MPPSLGPLPCTPFPLPPARSEARTVLARHSLKACIFDFNQLFIAPAQKGNTNYVTLLSGKEGFTFALRPILKVPKVPVYEKALARGKAGAKKWPNQGYVIFVTTPKLCTVKEGCIFYPLPSTLVKSLI